MTGRSGNRGRGISKRGRRGGVTRDVVTRSVTTGPNVPESEPTTPLDNSSTHEQSDINSNTIQSTESTNGDLLKITPEGDEFVPIEASKKISTIIKSKFDQPWIDWSHIPADVKLMWFGEFKKICIWDLVDHDEVVRIFHHKGAPVVRQSMADIRRGKSNGRWLQRSVYLELQEKWKSDEVFLKVSERNKKNIAANSDGRINHSGSISIPEAKRRLEKKLGKEVTYPELFETLNYDKSKDKWSTPASKNAFEAYNKMLEDVSQDGQKVDKNAIFLEANGGVNKKGRSWGFGASVKCHSSTSSSTTSSCKSKFTPHPTVEDNELKTRLHVVEEENGHLKSKLNVMEDQLASVVNMLEHLTGAKVASSSQPSRDGSDKNLNGEDDGDDLGDDE